MIHTSKCIKTNILRLEEGRQFQNETEMKTFSALDRMLAVAQEEKTG